VIEKEREDLKVPEEERKLIEQMSDIEKALVAKQDAAMKQKIKDDAKPDFSWWNYDDPLTYFTVSTCDQYSFAPGQ